MGQHKTNPNSILKKQGLLPPKPIPMGAPERRRRLQEMVEMKLTELMLTEGAKSVRKKREGLQTDES